jgi:hypothetical protein
LDNLINTHSSNGVVITTDKAYEVGLEMGGLIGHLAPTARLEWSKIFYDRNYGYGTHTWADLGLRSIYGAIYAKTQRYNETQKADAYTDIFGYTIIAGIYCNELGWSKELEIVEDHPGLLQSLHAEIWVDKTIRVDRAMFLFTNYLAEFGRKIECQTQLQ